MSTGDSPTRLIPNPATSGAVAALAADPRVMEKSGGLYRVGDLAQEYGFTDVDGRRMSAFGLPEP